MQLISVELISSKLQQQSSRPAARLGIDDLEYARPRLCKLAERTGAYLTTEFTKRLARSRPRRRSLLISLAPWRTFMAFVSPEDHLGAGGRLTTREHFSSVASEQHRAQFSSLQAAEPEQQQRRRRGEKQQANLGGERAVGGKVERDAPLHYLAKVLTCDCEAVSEPIVWRAQAKRIRWLAGSSSSCGLS